jgi:hypothetical protein
MNDSLPAPIRLPITEMDKRKILARSEKRNILDLPRIAIYSIRWLAAPVLKHER